MALEDVQVLPSQCHATSSKWVLFYRLLHCHHLQMTLSNLIWITSINFSAVRSQIAKDDLSNKWI